MKLKKLLKVSVVIALFTFNIFLFIKFKSSQNELKNLTNNKLVSEETKENTKQIEEKEEIKTEEQKDEYSYIKYIEDENLNIVGWSENRPDLIKFIEKFLVKKYTYKSLDEDRVLEDFYDDELKKEYLEYRKGRKSPPKFDLMSKVRNIEVHIHYVDENTFLVTTFHKRDVWQYNKITKKDNYISQNLAYTDTYLVVRKNKEYKIKKEEEFTIKNVRQGA